MFPHKLEVFLVFFSTIKFFGNSWDNSYFHKRYQGSLYLQRIKPALKRYKILKYYDKDCTVGRDKILSRKSKKSE